ncbi:MAG: insulinase family protein [Candidatus Eisenbacteria sp.]|nr:insulinase family protein [Candidatus Eisenbacteria bacterium]
MPRGQTSVFMTLIAAALLVAQPASGADVGRHRLANGVTVLTMPGEWNRIVAISVMVDAGSKHDPPTLLGLANLTNSMLVRGTTARTAPRLAELIDSAGLSMGVDTTRDYATVYVTAIDSQFDVALEVITDIIRSPAFDGTRLLEAQRIVHEEIDARQDDPFSTPLTRVAELIYDDHPYAHDPEGTVKGVERITPSHLVKFHTNRYVGGSTVVSIVGNFPEKHALKRLAELLSNYPDGQAPTADLPPVSMDEAETARVFKDVDVSHLAMGFVAPAAADPDFAAFEVLDALVGVGSGSRIAEALGENGAGLSDVAGAFCRCGQDVSTFVIYASTEDADGVIDVIESEIERLSTEPVSDEELDTARNRLIGRHVINGQTNLVRAARLASYELAGLGFDFADSLLEAVNRVDKDDIQRVASEWLRKPATVVVQPGKTAPPRGRKRAGI